MKNTSDGAYGMKVLKGTRGWSLDHNITMLFAGTRNDPVVLIQTRVTTQPKTEYNLNLLIIGDHVAEI